MVQLSVAVGAICVVTSLALASVWWAPSTPRQPDAPGRKPAAVPSPPKRGRRIGFQ